MIANDSRTTDRCPFDGIFIELNFAKAGEWRGQGRLCTWDKDDPSETLGWLFEHRLGNERKSPSFKLSVIPKQNSSVFYIS
jgi:hypothetical protein